MIKLPTTGGFGSIGRATAWGTGPRFDSKGCVKPDFKIGSNVFIAIDLLVIGSNVFITIDLSVSDKGDPQKIQSQRY